jgi:cell division protein FtsB
MAAVARRTTRQRLWFVAWIAIGVTSAWFAVQGGEYGTVDLMRQRSERVRLARQIDSLRHIVDSLRVYKQRVVNDPKTQERIAREEFGMVRGKELLYRFVDPDSQ